jgi:hypothetical protein
MDEAESFSQRLPALLVIGEFFTAAMEPVRLCVESLIQEGCDAHFSSGVSQLDRSSQADWFPDLVIVCQHWPDEFSERDIQRLVGRYPLARVTCCYGPWCRSDGRRRDLWPFAVRVPVEAVAGRIRREREVLAGRRQPLPLTASRDEVFVFDAEVL